VAQHARLDVAAAAVRVDQRAVLVLRDGVDSQVAAPEVVLERDLRPALEREAVVTAAGLALGARERVLLARLRVQEDREIPPDRPETRAVISSGVAPTTTQSRSFTGRPSSASRTAPPTR
jgi:predicted thioredoxin/glutaredoxin